LVKPIVYQTVKVKNEHIKHTQAGAIQASKSDIASGGTTYQIDETALATN
jgi:hypothetical protein